MNTERERDTETDRGWKRDGHGERKKLTRREKERKRFRKA